MYSIRDPLQIRQEIQLLSNQCDVYPNAAVNGVQVCHITTEPDCQPAPEFSHLTSGEWSRGVLLNQGPLHTPKSQQGLISLQFPSPVMCLPTSLILLSRRKDPLTSTGNVTRHLSRHFCPIYPQWGCLVIRAA